MHRVFIGLGGNLGKPQTAMREALVRLDERADLRIVTVSSLYRTAPWGKLDQPDFLNAVAEVATGLAPRDVLELCLDTERRLKRVRAERWGPRVIDLDILWFDGKTIDEPGLQLPHPRMQERAFVMVPLAEIAPDLQVGSETAAGLVSQLHTTEIRVAVAGTGWFRSAPASR